MRTEAVEVHPWAGHAHGAMVSPAAIGSMRPGRPMDVDGAAAAPPHDHLRDRWLVVQTYRIISTVALPLQLTQTGTSPPGLPDRPPRRANGRQCEISYRRNDR